MTLSHTEVHGTHVGGMEELPQGRASVRNRWALLKKNEQLTVLFAYDQVKLRFQYAIRRQYNPMPSWWKKKQIKRDIERLFEDVDEEIYFEEQLAKEVKGTESEKTKELSRVQKSQEDFEETITGYDKFTVEEEKKIQDMTKKAIERLVTSEKEKGII